MQKGESDGVELVDRSGASPDKAPPLDGLVRVIRRVVVGISTVCLALLMFLVAFDVIGRYLFNRPIPGGYELIEYLMAVLVPLSIAFCAEQRKHVGVDILVEHISPRASARLESVTLLVTVVLCAVIAWQCSLAIPESYASGLKSAVLNIPAYPTVIAVAVGMVALTLFVLANFIERVKEALSQ